MLRSYLKIALRNLGKNKVHTAINVLGLAIGMTCCLLIVLYVADELNYDRHWPDGERIYRIALERRYPDRVARYSIIPHSYVHSIRRELPEVAEATRLINFGGDNAPTLVKIDGQTHEERNVLLADSTFFRVFQIPLLSGQPDRVLNRPNTVVLTEETARRLFGKADPVGKTLEIVQGPKLEITGVCANPPDNSHFTFTMLGSTLGIPFLQQPNHISFSAHTYLLLKPGISPDAVQARLPALVEKYAAGEVERNFGVSYREYVRAGNGYFYFLQPLTGIHLDSNLESELRPNGSRTLVYIFSIIAGFVLLIAGINFMNLATARSSERAKEVGIRKTLGSTKVQLSVQFLIESVLLSLGALVLALVLALILLPGFNQLAAKQLSLRFLAQWYTGPLMLSLAVGIGLLAGLYPAGVLASFEPIRVLKGRFSATRSGHWLRNGLVVFQFAISIILIVSTVVVFTQLRYVQKKELGFDKEAVMTIQSAGFLDQRTEAFKQEVARLAGVGRVGGTTSTPGTENFFGTTFRKQADRETVTGRGMVIDDDYLQTLGIGMAAGRSFSRNFNDSLSVILNEEAVKALGLTNPVGQRIVSPDNFAQQGGPEVTYTVVGVVKDFHFFSLHQRIAPLFILHDRWFRRTSNQIVVRVAADKAEPVIAAVEQLWQRYLPEQPFLYSFLAEDWGELYRAEQVSQRVFGLFSLLAIFIACLGLLGLAIYIIQQRTKEIGIRKVLGASIPGLVMLLAGDFLKLVGIALLIGAPIAWYVMNQWLQGFAYRIDVEWWMFALAGALAVGIAFATVSYQSIKAALMNPVKSLRTE